RPVRVEGQLLHLLPGGAPDLVAVRVADVHGEQPGERVEVALAGRVLEVATLAAHDHRHAAVGVRAHAREVEPQVLRRRHTPTATCAGTGPRGSPMLLICAAP